MPDYRDKSTYSPEDNPVGKQCEYGISVVDKIEIAHTRREYRNSKRFLTLPGNGLDKWPIVTRRVTIDLDSGMVVADEIVLGMARSGLYRSLPQGISRMKTLFICDARVAKAIKSLSSGNDGSRL